METTYYNAVDECAAYNRRVENAFRVFALSCLRKEIAYRRDPWLPKKIVAEYEADADEKWRGAWEAFYYSRWEELDFAIMDNLGEDYGAQVSYELLCYEKERFFKRVEELAREAAKKYWRYIDEETGEPYEARCREYLKYRADFVKRVFDCLYTWELPIERYNADGELK